MSSSTDLTIGRIGRAHGIKGEVSVRVLVDDPTHFAAGARLEAGDRELVVAHSRPHKNTLLVVFEDVTSRSDAEELRGLELTARRVDRRPLEPGEFWPEDLIGLAAHAEGTRIGEITDVIAGTAQDRLVLRLLSGETIEVPFVDELVPEVLLDQGKVLIAPLDGLISE